MKKMHQNTKSILPATIPFIRLLVKSVNYFVNIKELPEQIHFYAINVIEKTHLNLHINEIEQ